MKFIHKKKKERGTTTKSTTNDTTKGAEIITSHLCSFYAIHSYTLIQHNDTCFDWFLYSDSSHMFLSFVTLNKKSNQFAFDFAL